MDRDVQLGQMASPQYGVFTRAQAKACGFSNRMIQHRLETGSWTGLHPGVYAGANVPASWERDQIAACYWSRGPAAGLAAGYLHHLPGCESPAVEVTTRDRARAMPRCGIVVHATNRLPEEQVTSIRRIPVTSIERTLLDLCGRFGRRSAAIAIDNSLSRGLTTVGELDYCLFRTARRGRNGCGRLRDLIEQRASLPVAPTTPLETVVFQMIVDHGLPLPELQHAIVDAAGRFVARPDFVYVDQKLIIEAHSRLWHEGHEKRDSDARRDMSLRMLGFDILYVTWPDATHYRDRTAAIIRERLDGNRPELRGPERAHLLLS